ncbi:MAG: D-serine ammonia-lyase, partial [Variovorax sp.]
MTNDDIAGRSAAAWRAEIPLIDTLSALEETSWFNPGIAPASEALRDVGLGADDVAAASARLDRFAPWIARVFPQTQAAGGLIESGIVAMPALQAALCREAGISPLGALWLKQDSHLPISGSIKARGGFYEVLAHAERLAVGAGLLREDEDHARLDSDAFRAFFGRHRIAVGSTGNLGLSIGLMGAKLGFDVTVHMSADARAWKKARLRANGVRVGRQAEADPQCHFVDDENSTDLFLGYAVAAERLKMQLDAEHIAVDAAHPLFVYLPCGVGGGPGGVAFGLKFVFGDAVHCVFAEPTHAPCMLLGVRTGLHDAVSVQDFGIDGTTAADGLAVGRASGFVGRAMQRLIDGYITVSDDTLFHHVAQLDALEGLRLEPSAV